MPGCPDWTTADLVWHIGEVHDFWGWIVRERALEPDAYVDPQRPGAGLPVDEAFAAVATFASERAAELYRVLADTDPATPVWSWAPQHDVAWVTRRMAHETAVHRVDAEHAAGGEHRLAPELAADGIDEFLEFFFPARRSPTRRRSPAACTCTAPMPTASGRCGPTTTAATRSPATTPRPTPPCAARPTTC